MKKITTFFCSLFVSLILLAGNNPKETFTTGNPDIQSINALSFGPEGILFIGDSKSANIYAIDTKDLISNPSKVEYNVKTLDKKIADLLGTTSENISIEDLAINPISKNAYLAVTHTSGSFSLLKIDPSGGIVPLDLSDISYSNQTLTDVIEADAKDRRGRSQRKWAISDLTYNNGKVYVTGLSNQEFGSTFRAMPFPFTGKQQMSSLEIYHAAHGQYETHAPIKTFTTAELNGSEYIIASYTCTPLVVFPASDLEPGKHIKGRTVAELGNRNTPLDMIVINQDNKSYLLLANSSRGMMKIDLSDVANFNESLTTPVDREKLTAGVAFEALPQKDVVQMDKLGENSIVMIQKQADGSMSLWTSN